MVVSNLIGHCVDRAHYLSTVPHVIASAADLRSFSPNKRVERHSELARDKTRQTGHGNKDYINRQVCELLDGTFNLNSSIHVHIYNYYKMT